MDFFSRLRKKKKQGTLAEDGRAPQGTTTLDPSVQGAPATFDPPPAAAASVHPPAPTVEFQAERSATTSVPPNANNAETTPEEEEEDVSEGLKILVSKPADAAGCVDVIALHGLGGNLLTTWTDNTTCVN